MADFDLSERVGRTTKTATRKAMQSQTSNVQPLEGSRGSKLPDDQRRPTSFNPGHVDADQASLHDICCAYRIARTRGVSDETRSDVPTHNPSLEEVHKDRIRTTNRRKDRRVRSTSSEMSSTHKYLQDVSKRKDAKRLRDACTHVPPSATKCNGLTNVNREWGMVSYCQADHIQLTPTAHLLAVSDIGFVVNRHPNSLSGSQQESTQTLGKGERNTDNAAEDCCGPTTKGETQKRQPPAASRRPPSSRPRLRLPARLASFQRQTQERRGNDPAQGLHRSRRRLKNETKKSNNKSNSNESKGEKRQDQRKPKANRVNCQGRRDPRLSPPPSDYHTQESAAKTSPGRREGDTHRRPTRYTTAQIGGNHKAPCSGTKSEGSNLRMHVLEEHRYQENSNAPPFLRHLPLPDNDRQPQDARKRRLSPRNTPPNLNNPPPSFPAKTQAASRTPFTTMPFHFEPDPPRRRTGKSPTIHRLDHVREPNHRWETSTDISSAHTSGCKDAPERSDFETRQTRPLTGRFPYVSMQIQRRNGRSGAVGGAGVYFSKPLNRYHGHKRALPSHPTPANQLAATRDRMLDDMDWGPGGKTDGARPPVTQGELVKNRDSIEEASDLVNNMMSSRATRVALTDSHPPLTTYFANTAPDEHTHRMRRPPPSVPSSQSNPTKRPSERCLHMLRTTHKDVLSPFPPNAQPPPSVDSYHRANRTLQPLLPESAAYTTAVGGLATAASIGFTLRFMQTDNARRPAPTRANTFRREERRLPSAEYKREPGAGGMETGTNKRPTRAFCRPAESSPFTVLEKLAEVRVISNQIRYTKTIIVGSCLPTATSNVHVIITGRDLAKQGNLGTARIVPFEAAKSGGPASQRVHIRRSPLPDSASSEKTSRKQHPHHIRAPPSRRWEPLGRLRPRLESEVKNGNGRTGDCDGVG
ncbi:hypothetical protein C8F01DRAFT_1311397 [Mycena amicta]|nr:hypothetical protein C8F01DRAFT_1311397 [Mycena amicta]